MAFPPELLVNRIFPHDALYQNFTYGCSPPLRWAARALDEKSLQTNLLSNHLSKSFLCKGDKSYKCAFLVCGEFFSLDSRNIDCYSPDNRKIVDWDVKLNHQQLKTNKHLKV